MASNLLKNQVVQDDIASLITAVSRLALVGCLVEIEADSDGHQITISNVGEQLALNGEVDDRYEQEHHEISHPTAIVEPETLLKPQAG